MPSISSNGAKRILIIHTDGNTFNNPSLKCIVDLFLEKGYEIDLRYPVSRAPMLPYRGVAFLEFGKLLRHLKIVLYDWLCCWPLIYAFVYLERLVLYNKQYALIVGVDRQGLIEASVLNHITKVPYVFMSFEIMFESETSRKYKSVEKTAAKDLYAWLIQDEVRAQQLQTENNLDPANKFILPLASAGLGCPTQNRLRDYLGIPKDMKVAIMVGSLTSWTMVWQVIDSVPTWPDNWVLIVHDRYGDTSKLLGQSRFSDSHVIKRKIFVSDDASTLVDDMGWILSGIDVGLAFYQAVCGSPYTGKNIEYLGLASGKISTYLRYGVPVMVNNIGLYADDIRSYGLGIVVHDFKNIPEKLAELGGRDLSDNVRRYFLQKLDFNLYREALWQKLSMPIAD